MMSSVKETTIHSLKWSTIEKIGQFSIQLIISIVLARLLGPDDYAIIGILNIFITISTVLVDAGFSQGLIRKLNCTYDDYNSVFWFNLIVSILLYIILYYSMPCIAISFNNKSLIDTGRVLMLILPLQALNVVQVTIVNKKLQFKKIAKYTLFVTPIAGCIGIIMAYTGYGVWALVIQTLLVSSLTVIVFWFKSEWKPTFSFKATPIIELFSFSSKLSASSLLNSIFNNLYPIIIAKFYSRTQFGYYSQAYKYATMPTGLIESIVNRITYPILVTLKNEKLQYKAAYKKMQIMMFAFVLPFMLGLFLCGYEVFVLLLGEKWISSIPFFQILCIAGISLPFHSLSVANLKTYGMSGIIFNLEIVKKIIFLVILVISLKWGIFGLVWGQTIYLWIVLVINMYYGGKQIYYSLLEQIKDIYPLFVLVVFSLVITWFLVFCIEGLFFRLFFKIFFFIALYVGGIIYIKIPQFFLIQKMIRKRV